MSGSMYSAGTMREGGSVYHDAYTGLEDLEEQIALANQMNQQISGNAYPQLESRNSINGKEAPQMLAIPANNAGVQSPGSGVSTNNPRHS